MFKSNNFSGTDLKIMSMRGNIYERKYVDGTDSVPKRPNIQSSLRGITQKERIQRSQHGESFKVEEIYQFSNYSSPLETQPEETLKPVYFAASSWLHW